MRTTSIRPDLHARGSAVRYPYQALFPGRQTISYNFNHCFQRHIRVVCSCTLLVVVLHM